MRDLFGQRQRRLFDLVDGRFRPLQEAGTGAICRVDFAQDVRTTKCVALKRLHDEHLGNARARQTLRNEAAALSMLNHPGVPRIYHAELESDDPYIVQEFIQGRMLCNKNLHDTSPMGVLKAVYPLLGILAELHHRGIVHRDISFRNLFMRGGEYPVALIDYGLSKVPGVPDLAIDSLEPIGTPAFMAPEQTYRGASVDCRADIYSAGVLLYILATARNPYQHLISGGGDAMLMAHRHGEPLPLDLSVPGMGRLSLIIGRALEKDPNRRYPCGAEMMDAAGEAIEHGFEPF
ncbi:MAG: serine/threonine-protein kinase [Candidatus Micrarchaeota archaeon]